MNMIDLIAEAGIATHLSKAGQAYAQRHGVRSAPNLAVMTDEVAGLIAAHLHERIEGRTVIDVGGGLGLLALHMASSARRVFVVEANPVWSLAWLEFFQDKPANVTYVWGAADELLETIRADVALVCTHSDVQGMMAIAQQLAPLAIDVFGELIDENPQAFDEWARNARNSA